MSKVEAAVAWARRGFRVFPCFPDRPGEAGNDRKAKKPVWEGWTEWASNDEATIRSWWGTHEYNIGCLTNDMLVVDLDTKPGKVGLMSWNLIHGAFDTFTVRTPTGGFHLYYRDANVAINQGALGKDIDVRSHHGYTLAPGSTVDGLPYAVEIEQPMAPPPAAVLACCKPPGQRAENAHLTLVDADDPRAVALAVDAVAAAPAAIQGELSEAAYKLACKLRDYGVSEAMCCALMVPWGQRCMPPVIGDDLNARIANAYLYAQNAGGSKHPEIMFGGVVIPPLPEPEVQIATAPVIAGPAFGNTLPMFALQPRPWVLRGLLLRREITTLVAPGGVGKSLLQLTIACFLAAGADFYGHANIERKPLRSVIYNAEDNLNEMSMRLYAICTHLGFDPGEIMPHIRLISGKDHGKLRLVNGGPSPSINEDAFKRLIDLGADVYGLDPLNKLHTVSGNDNVLMSFVMEQLEQMAEVTDAALMLSHHTSKPAFGSSTNYAGNAHGAQGAAAVVDSSRIVMTLMAPSEEDALRYGLSEKDRRMFLRLDDAKNNRTLATDDTLWLQKKTATLWTGEAVGALVKADMGQHTDGMKNQMATTLANAMMSNEGGGAVLSLKMAAELIRTENPLYEKMKISTLYARMQTFLSDSVTLPDGRRITCSEEHGAWKILLS